MNKLATVLLCAIMLSISASASAAEAPEPGAQSNPIIKTVKIYSKVVDLLGKGPTTGLALYVDSDKYDNPIAWRLAVNGHTRIVLPQPAESYFGSASEVKVTDLDGDNRAEILLFRTNTGSGGAKGLSIYTPAKAWLKPFSLENPDTDASLQTTDSYEVVYTQKGQVSFTDKKTGLKAMIALANNRYGDDEIAGEELMKHITTWIDPVMDYTFSDADGDGVQEITTIQRVIGVSHADTIAILKRTYAQRNGIYTAITETLTDESGKKLAKLGLEKKPEDTAAVKS